MLTKVDTDTLTKDVKKKVIELGKTLGEVYWKYWLSYQVLKDKRVKYFTDKVFKRIKKMVEELWLDIKDYLIEDNLVELPPKHKAIKYIWDQMYYYYKKKYGNKIPKKAYEKYFKS